MADLLVLPAENERLRRRIVRLTASDVAVIIAGVETIDVAGNICVPKPPFVAALAGYFAEAGASRHMFIEQAYGRDM